MADPKRAAIAEDPVWLAAMNAPQGEPETDEERAAVAGAKAEVRGGARMLSSAEITASIEAKGPSARARRRSLLAAGAGRR